jgi:signal transduction histidine kinase
LNINAIESGAMTLNMESVNLKELLSQCVAEYAETAIEKSITIHTNYPSSMELHTDKDKLHEIVDNLLSNALKFSHGGSNIYVHLSEQSGKAVISIKDEGQGMTDEDKERLFIKFARLSSTPTAGENSTGLGLAIVKRLTDEIGGTITCESEKGVGTEFVVKLPVH